MVVCLCVPTANESGRGTTANWHVCSYLFNRNRSPCGAKMRNDTPRVRLVFVVRCCTRECTDPKSTVILSKALALAQGTAAASPSGRWWPMGKARDKAGKRGAAGQQADKAKERSERARLKKDRQRNSVYSSSADDREFEAQVRE